MPRTSATDHRLPPLREVIARHDLIARKKLGQHFLLDENLTDRIARSAGNLDGVNVIEIGAGPGGLTRALLRTSAACVTAIERDTRCIGALRELEPHYPGRLIIVEGDALEIDTAAMIAAPRRIVANLPYNISVPLILAWLRHAEKFTGFTLMVQKEVADRLAASPGSKTYGRLSVMSQWKCRVRQIFTVSPQAFVPPPKVTSAIIDMEPLVAPVADADWKSLEIITATAFGQRRKMLRSSLKPLNFDLESLGITPTARAEELNVAEFCTLARAYRAQHPIVGPTVNNQVAR
jgi:16S rRNA (adenine1518-N6/adenine1519-N6)-dimethyltransferase